MKIRIQLKDINKETERRRKKNKLILFLKDKIWSIKKQILGKEKN